MPTGKFLCIHLHFCQGLFQTLFCILLRLLNLDRLKVLVNRLASLKKVARQSSHLEVIEVFHWLVDNLLRIAYFLLLRNLYAHLLQISLLELSPFSCNFELLIASGDRFNFFTIPLSKQFVFLKDFDQLAKLFCFLSWGHIFCFCLDGGFIWFLCRYSIWW